MRGRWLRRVAACGLLVSLVVLVAGPAAAWWDGKWKYRKKIVLDTTPQGGDVKEGLADFPVLVRLHSGNFTFANAKSDGADIRLIAADDKTPLKYHIERYDPAGEMVLIWVKVPRLAAASNQDSLWIYYGNSAAADGQDAGGSLRYGPTGGLSPRRKGGRPPGCHLLQEPREGVYGQARHTVRHRPGHYPERRWRPPGDRQIPFPQLREGFHFFRLGPHGSPPDRWPPLLLGRREAVGGDRRRGDEAALRHLGSEKSCPGVRRAAAGQVGPRGGDGGGGQDALYLHGRKGEVHFEAYRGHTRARCRYRRWGLSPGKTRLRGGPRRGRDSGRCPLIRMGPCG